MLNLPYRTASFWSWAVLATIIAVNAAVLVVAEAPAAFPWLVTPETAVFAKMLLHPSPWLLWFWGDVPPWADAYRLLAHGYLHGGWDHLAFNMLPFAPLAWLTARRVGAFGLLCLYHLLMVLAAFGYLWAMLLTANGVINAGNYFLPMAGASGAVHGLAGLWVVWAVQDRAGNVKTRRGLARRLWPAALWLGFVMAVNIWVYVAMQGEFAWSLHIAGVLIGMALAPLIPNLRPRIAQP